MPCRYQICYLRVFTVKVSGDLPKTLVKLAAQEIKECGWCVSAVQKRSCLHSLYSVVSLRLLVSLGFCGQGNNCNVLTVSIETNRFIPLLCLKVTSAAGISGLGKDLLSLTISVSLWSQCFDCWNWFWTGGCLWEIVACERCCQIEVRLRFNLTLKKTHFWISSNMYRLNEEPITLS